MDHRGGLEVADIFRRIQPKISELFLSADKYRVFRAIVACRTAELGGHLNRCGRCGYEEQSYNSCWNRHCPKCRGGEAFAWVAERAEELLPVSYFHVVFTIPQELRTLCYANKRICYEIFYKASSATLLEVSQNNLGLTPGFFGVLHTWNQELNYHPHLHYVISGGGINSTGKWQSFSRNGKFFLPVRILSRVFRGKFISMLKRCYHRKALYLKGALSHLENPREFEHLLSRAAAHEWVVYAKRPFAGPEVVLKYLASYTHRVGISNRRLRQLDDNSLVFSARHPTRKGKKRLVTISPKLFVQRFLLHVLPKGFRRIRYFGFLAASNKGTLLAEIRAQLAMPMQLKPKESPPQACPRCKSGVLHLVELFNPHRKPRKHWFPPFPISTTRDTLCLSPPLHAKIPSLVQQ